MLPVKILVGILAEVGKHTAVIHMMTVNNAVVGKSEVAVFLHIGNAVIAVLLFKAAFQIVVRIVNRLHYRIVDVCSLNGNPAHKIAVLLIDRSVLFKGGLFGLRGFGFLRLIGGRRFVLHKCSDIVKGFGALFLVRILPITAVRNKDDSDIGEFTSSIFEKLFCVGLGMAYFMILISKILGHLFFAKDFFAAWTMTPLLTVSTIFSTLSLFLGAQFTASKRSDLHLKSNIISMIANVILNLILIKEMGIDGAAYGTMISYFIVLVYRMVKTQGLIKLTFSKIKLYLMCVLLIVAATVTAVEQPGYLIITVLLFAVSMLAYKSTIQQVVQGAFHMIAQKK